MEILDPHIPIKQIRPRFMIEAHMSASTIEARLKEGLSRPDRTCIGEANSSYAILQIPIKDQHYWSPQLQLTFEESSTETIVRGVYGPRPAVWTMFVFFYAVLIFIAGFIGVYGLSLLSMGESAQILWAVPVIIIIFFSLYHVAYIGKKKGYAQGQILRTFFEVSTGLDY